MAKQGMKRPDHAHTKEKNPAVEPEIQEKTKSSKEKTKPIIAGTRGATQKVYHAKIASKSDAEKTISKVYPEIDNDLARDNIEIDIPAADLQDL